MDSWNEQTTAAIYAAAKAAGITVLPDGKTLQGGTQKDFDRFILDVMARCSRIGATVRTHKMDDPAFEDRQAFEGDHRN